MSAAQSQVGAETIALAVDHASKSFGNLKALNDVSLSVARGTVLCIVGPSGAGKSTLLRCIHRCETIDRGTIRAGGEVIAGDRSGDELHESRDIDVARQHPVTGMVPQRPDLPEHMTALQAIVEGPLTLLKRPRRQIVAEAMALLARVGLADRRDAYPGELSGGQRRRVVIARALAPKPKLMLFDEPLSALDSGCAGAVLAVMRELAADGMTMIVATRDGGFLREMADAVVIMERGEIVEPRIERLPQAQA